MKFVAYLTYNNNGDSLVGLDQASHGVAPGFTAERPITFDHTDDGIVLFRHRFANFRQKLAYYTHLQENLIKTFGYGFSVAAAAASDCSNDEEMTLFCAAMKRIDPAMVTILYASPVAAMPEDVRDNYWTATDELPFDFYKKTPLITACDAFATSASGKALREGIDHFCNFWVWAPDTQNDFIRLIRHENGQPTPFDLTSELKEKIGKTVAISYAASEGKTQTFTPSRYVAF